MQHNAYSVAKATPLQNKVELGHYYAWRANLGLDCTTQTVKEYGYVMPLVPFYIRLFFRGAAALLLGMAWGMAAHAAHGPKPAPSQRIPLEGTGYQPASPDILLTKGFSMDTLHFVDDHHLLLTFNPRVLVPRPVDDPSTHDDQIVDGVLLELPSGKVVARTRWHMHDHGQYIWTMGPGRFLLREGRVLSALLPEANLHKQNPLLSVPLMTLTGAASSIDISPSGSLLVTQSVNLSGKSAQEGDAASHPIFTDVSAVQIVFTRLQVLNAEKGMLMLDEVGHANVSKPVVFSVNDEGSLQAEFVSENTWRISLKPLFDPRKYLGFVASTCHPRFAFLSEDELLAMTCRGSEQDMTLVALTMDGQELWEQNFSEQHVSLHLLAQPAAGRFAMSRVLTNAPVPRNAELDPDRASAEEVLVIDSRTGETVMQTTALPMEVAAQNYALSRDGRNLAVLKNMTLEIYNLPPQPEDIAKAKGNVPKRPTFVAISDKEVEELTKTDRAVADETKRAAAAEEARRKAAMPEIFTSPSLTVGTAQPPTTQTAKSPADTSKPADNSGNQNSNSASQTGNSGKPTGQPAATQDTNPDNSDPMQNLQIVPDTPPK